MTIIIIIFVYFNCRRTVQSTQHKHLPRRAGHTTATMASCRAALCTEGLSTAELLPQYGAQQLINCTSLTSGTFTRWRNQRTSDKVAHCSIYRPRKDERLSWPSWLTYSTWLTHISGHPSAAGRAWNRESSPAKSGILPLCHAAKLSGKDLSHY